MKILVNQKKHTHGYIVARTGNREKMTDQQKTIDGQQTKRQENLQPVASSFQVIDTVHLKRKSQVVENIKHEKNTEKGTSCPLLQKDCVSGELLFVHVHEHFRYAKNMEYRLQLAVLFKLEDYAFKRKLHGTKFESENYFQKLRIRASSHCLRNRKVCL